MFSVYNDEFHVCNTCLDDNGKLPFASGTDASNATDDAVVEDIIDSVRTGKSLGKYEEVYEDPNIKDALAGEDEGRNFIKSKLCKLGFSKEVTIVVSIKTNSSNNSQIFLNSYSVLNHTHFLLRIVQRRISGQTKSNTCSP